MLTRRSALAGLGVLAAAPLAAQAGGDAAAALALLDRLAWHLLALDPGTATALGRDTGAHAALRGRLDDRSFAGLDARRAFLRAALADLAALPRDRLDASLATSLAVADSAFRTALDGLALPYGDATIGSWRNTPYVVIQNVGGWLDVPQLLEGDQPLDDAADTVAYASRVAGTAALLDGETARVAAARAQGLVPPDFLLDRTIAGLERTIRTADRRDGPFVGPLARKFAARGQGTEAVDALQATVRAHLIPALERQLAEIRAGRAVATSDAGMLRRPHGEEWYAWGLRASTTTRRPAADLHRMGLDRLAELHARMDVILRGFGLTQGSVAARAAALQARPEYAFAPDDTGRAAIIRAMQERIAAIRPRLPQAFRRLVRGNLEIRRMPAAQEPGAPAAYGGPGSIDGTIPGKIWVNLGDPTIHNRVNIGDLVYHEGIPGHVWQGEYAQQLPLIRAILAFNAYSEGWALYAEQLADELGVYDDDPAGRLGLLMGLAERAVRLVVDTGIHAYGWTRDEALNRFVEATASPASNAASEIDRYCAWPGQACGYMVGQSEILALRARTRAALGARYDVRDFNQAVVDAGNVPLDVLAATIDRQIADAR